MKKSIKEKRKENGAGYLMVYNDLMWFFSNKNCYLEKGFSRTDAEVMSFIIDAENLNIKDETEKNYINGYFKCTSSFANYKLEYTETTIFKSIKRLKSFGIISCIVFEGERFIKINEKVLNIILCRFKEYEIEIDNMKDYKFINPIERSKHRDFEKERALYDKYTSLVVEDVNKLKVND